MKKTAFVLLTLFIFFSVTASAQSMGSTYKTALGIKFYPGAITLKHFTAKDRALEGVAYLWQDGFRFTGLYEFHGNIKGAPGLKWYAGPGAHIGAWNERWKRKYPYYTGRSYFYAGVDGVLGLDYKIKAAPINLSIDWQPSFNFGNWPGDYYGFYGGWGGFAIRYTF